MYAIRKMKEHIIDWVAVILAIIFSLFYWAGIPSVPFHPDESTQIFMSSDVELFFQQPASLGWKPAGNNDLRQLYRLLDAPLTRDMIGLGRLFTHSPALRSDWSWSLSWEKNAAAGALPTDNLLQVSRFSVAWLFPFSLIFIYLSGKKVNNRVTGFSALILLAGSALVLLHSRRAMAESALIFTVILSFWSLLCFQKRPWLTAIPIALAFAAKQSTAGLFLIGIIAIVLRELPASKKRMAEYLAYFLALFLAMTFLLNPFTWVDPFGAISSAIAARQDLLQRQVSEYSQLIPGQVLVTIPDRILWLVSSLFLTPLQFSETGNYLAQTQASVIAYLANPVQDVMRNAIGGGIFFFFSLAGFILVIVKFRNESAVFRQNMALMVLATLVISVSLVLSVQLAFQRYVLPAVPFIILWAAYGLEKLIWNPSVQLYQRVKLAKVKRTTPT
jgi:hypothetical protein